MICLAVASFSGEYLWRHSENGDTDRLFRLCVG